MTNATPSLRSVIGAPAVSILAAPDGAASLAFFAMLLL